VLIFAEGYDDYATESDLSLSAAAVTNCSVIAGRGGNGFAAQIGAGGTVAYAVPASAGSNVIAGFALTGVSGLDPLDFAVVQFQAGGSALFSIVQASAAGLLFFDATNPLTPVPGSGFADLSTGLIGSATYHNWGSYIEVQLLPGNPGTVTVKVDGITVLSTSGAFGPVLSTTLETNNIGNGSTGFNVLTDFGLATPFAATLVGVASSPHGVATHITVTATAGTGNTTWTVAPISGGHNYIIGDAVTAPAPVGVCNGIQFSTQIGGTGTPVAALDDLYICDTTGAVNNGFLGNTRIISQAPTGDGADLEWTPSTGSAHWPLVNAYPINYGATEVTATAAGNRDTYTYPALPVLGAFTTLRALQIAIYCESQGGGGGDTITGLVRIGGVDYPGAAQPTPAVWQRVATVYELDPATAALWTGANVNAGEFGEKRTA
jgi:hypothetical protein